MPKATRSPRRDGLLTALPWIGPALLLIGAVVLFPAGYMVYNSFRDINSLGIDRGWAGLRNYQQIFELGDLGPVLGNTAVWVLGVVCVTLLLSLPLAQFLDKRFPGRRAIRMALVVPWAASVVMTSTIFVYGLDPFYGILNRLLVDIGLLDTPYGFLKDPASGFACAMAVAVFVSLPFTTFVVLAGLQAIPGETLEAATTDGAGPWRTYWHIVLPMLRPAITVATIINIINVFNSLPILRTMTGSIPGHDADTTTTLTFKLIELDQQVDEASALSMLNFVGILLMIVLYVRLARPIREQ